MKEKELEDLIGRLAIVHKCLSLELERLKNQLNEMKNEKKVKRIIKKLKVENSESEE